MADKFHINEMGNPGKCSATKSGCPFGSDSDHFDSEVAARASFENAKTEQLFAPLKKSKVSKTAKPSRPISELNKLAKTSTDLEVLTEAAENGSDRTFGNLAVNPAATREVLATAFARTNDRATKMKLQTNSNFPIGQMDVDGVTQLHRKDQRSFGMHMASDEITDAQAEIVMDKFAYNGAAKMLSNPNNQITTPTLIKLAEADTYALQIAVGNNPRYPTLERLPHLDNLQTEQVVMKTSDQEVIRAVYNSPQMKENTKVLKHRMVTNQNTPTDVLDNLGKLEHDEVNQAHLYNHPNASEDLKDKIRSINPTRFN